MKIGPVSSLFFAFTSMCAHTLTQLQIKLSFSQFSPDTPYILHYTINNKLDYFCFTLIFFSWQYFEFMLIPKLQDKNETLFTY